ncbi:MAG: 8-oxoguanine DNA glycosylase, N-terminal domain-containing protein, partial [Lachnospiraceae bacterium]|nr:8-oxoguanine DNA glycosylase, N-terminal domain-containing protein [Lachnospiraceae bacterium]
MDYIVKGRKEFNIERVLECGQCFHFVKIGDLDYALVHRDRLLRISQEGDDIIFRDTTEDEYRNIWAPYFDMNTDYDAIKKRIMDSDPRMKEPVENCAGIRILRQEFFETLISFIISQNKQIPHIKKIVAAISERCGKYLGMAGDIP